MFDRICVGLCRDFATSRSLIRPIFSKVGASATEAQHQRRFTQTKQNGVKFSEFFSRSCCCMSVKKPMPLSQLFPVLSALLTLSLGIRASDCVCVVCTAIWILDFHSNARGLFLNVFIWSPAVCVFVRLFSFYNDLRRSHVLRISHLCCRTVLRNWWFVLWTNRLAVGAATRT